MSTRREFITLLGGTAVAWPLAARAQQPAKPAIGFLSSQLDIRHREPPAFRQGLKELGYIEGQNVTVEYRWADGRIGPAAGAGGRIGSPSGGGDRASAPPAAIAAKAATSTIPIVFPVASTRSSWDSLPA